MRKINLSPEKEQELNEELESIYNKLTKTEISEMLISGNFKKAEDYDAVLVSAEDYDSYDGYDEDYDSYDGYDGYDDSYDDGYNGYDELS